MPAEPDDVAPEVEPAEPATPIEPAEEMPAEEPSEPAEPATEEIDDLFSEPAPGDDAEFVPAEDDAAEEPIVPADAPADDDTDLFGEPANDAIEAAPADVEEAMPAEDEAAPAVEEEAPADDDVDDLLGETEQPASEFRLWTDNTGEYQVQAKLVEVLDGKVRLLKDTGRFTTVPFERLSHPDLAFVMQQHQLLASGR
jgi:hypothetical protein